MTRHFLDLPEAKPLATPAYLLTRRAVEDIAAAMSIGLVYGAAGLGKTFAVEEAVGRQEVECCWFDFPGRTTTKELVKSLLERTTGVPQEGTRAQLEERLMDSLAERPRLVVIDEAQRLYAESIEYLRHLWDRAQAQFSLLLVGGDGCWQVISRYPMVLSRLHRRIHFERLSEPEVLDLIPRFHPIYADAEPELLADIDREFADGNLRAWASFTETAATIMQRAGQAALNQEVIAAALRLLGQDSAAA